MEDTLGGMMDCFVVLPDTAAGDCAAWRVPFTTTDIFRYPSGRPWIMLRRGLGHATEIKINEDLAVVLVGPSQIERQVLQLISRRMAKTVRINEVVKLIPGIFHVLVRYKNSIRLQGTASGVRRVYFSTLSGAVVSSDRGEVLAKMTNASLKHDNLAVRLLEPVPHPLGDSPLWEGIHQIPAGQCLELRGNQMTMRKWWQPPSPEVPIKEGAEAVYDALSRSVSAHMMGHDSVSCELSGGIDSSILLGLSSRHAVSGSTSPVIAITADTRDPTDEDPSWARLVARSNKHVKHHIVSSSTLPLTYADPLRGTSFWTEEPTTSIASHARVRSLLQAAISYESTVHFSGHGGDHLFTGLPTLAADLLRRDPIRGLSLVKSYRSMFNWPLGTVIRQLAFPGTYGTWLKNAMEPVRNASWEHPILNWGLQPNIPDWLTSRAKDLIQSKLEDAARTAEPLAPTPGRHLELDGIRDGARFVRSLTDVAAQEGLNYVAPFFDDRVIEAALQVRIEDRVEPTAYKPLLITAMRGVLPEQLTHRTTKGSGSLDSALGIRRHGPELTELWQDSVLANLGLVDADRLKTLCMAPDSLELADDNILSTLATETWLQHRYRHSNTNSNNEEEMP